ncbi:hypothetical protein MTR_5g040060 [Medicago truncatula]|uniref:Uncharacterized protein n=1 Tax=Medicago truncatula TaxID=3880 RepID=G7KDV6_MEDTR|nr:hypothetical protein MTR_5g040060 [Medicago truncatula]
MDHTYRTVRLKEEERSKGSERREGGTRWTGSVQMNQTGSSASAAFFSDELLESRHGGATARKRKDHYLNISGGRIGSSSLAVQIGFWIKLTTKLLTRGHGPNDFQED